jgi:hypothetical protein
MGIDAVVVGFGGTVITTLVAMVGPVLLTVLAAYLNAATSSVCKLSRRGSQSARRFCRRSTSIDVYVFKL